MQYIDYSAASIYHIYLHIHQYNEHAHLHAYNISLASCFPFFEKEHPQGATQKSYITWYYTFGYNLAPSLMQVTPPIHNQNIKTDWRKTFQTTITGNGNTMCKYHYPLANPNSYVRNSFFFMLSKSKLYYNFSESEEH